MTIRHQILILHYLTMLQDKSEYGQLKPITEAFAHLLSRDELLFIRKEVAKKRKQCISTCSISDKELLKQIGDQYHILSYLIDNLQKKIEL